ncbi:MAG: hypothetical protein GTO30_07370, partial [Acidobacteria bacterium]|nr:hypothetical protein [Acidobacteriota bacterium]NIQ86380.1 hypothetical protein [Acidobacteriota bacterium]
MRLLNWCSFVRGRGAGIAACVLAVSLCAGCATQRVAPSGEPVAAEDPEAVGTGSTAVETSHAIHDPDGPPAGGSEDAFWAGIVDSDAEQDLLPGEEATPAPHDLLA